jgi:hypothetical protein
MVVDQRLLLAYERGKEETKHCQECGSATRDGKPYCSDHVAMNLAAKETLAGIAVREAHLMLIDRHGQRGVYLDSPLVDDVFRVLRDRAGAATLRRIRSDTGLPLRALSAIVRVLAAGGSVSLERTRRRDLLVTLKLPC